MDRKDLVFLSSTPDCDEAIDCPKLALHLVDGRVFAVGEAVTDASALAALGVLPGEGAVALPDTGYVENAARRLEDL